jgi:hypothetical protein
VYERDTLVCNKDFFFCDGDECHLCQGKFIPLFGVEFFLGASDLLLGASDVLLGASDLLFYLLTFYRNESTLI